MEEWLIQILHDFIFRKGPPKKYTVCSTKTFEHSGFVLYIFQYLLENNRMVNIFTDQLYVTFAEELNKIVSQWLPSMSPNGELIFLFYFHTF